MVLQPGQPAPDFAGSAVINGEFKEIKNADYSGKYVVLFFYPSDFTFVCPTEILAFNDRLKEFHDLGAEVIACSCDTKFTHLAWTKVPRKEGGVGQLSLTLLADRTQAIARAYGVLQEASGNSFRGLFVIDPKGNLRIIVVHDMPVGRSVDEAIRVVQALQFNEKHGEVCPANWKPGSDTIKANPKDSKEYFSKHG
jgi:alkyl hydroperoxide reductase subunit AhpC